MTNLLLAALLLPASHFLVSSTALRPALIRAIGENAYQALYSLLAVAAFAWLIHAYIGAPKVDVWTPPVGVKIAAAIVGVVAMILIVASVTTRNPVIVRSDGLLDDPDIVRGMLRVTRNGFFWGTGLLAAAHAASAGDAAATLAFGSVAFLGLAGGGDHGRKKSSNGRKALEGLRSCHIEPTVRRDPARTAATGLARNRRLAGRDRPCARDRRLDASSRDGSWCARRGREAISGVALSRPSPISG